MRIKKQKIDETVQAIEQFFYLISLLSDKKQINFELNIYGTYGEVAPLELIFGDLLLLLTASPVRSELFVKTVIFPNKALEERPFDYL